VVVAVSTPLVREIARFAGVRAVLIPNGADPDRFDPARIDGRRVRERLGVGGALTVGWAGIMREWHGLELLLDAVGGLPGAQLLVLGDGPARAAFEQHAAAIGVADRIVITGRIPHDEMPEHLAAMDVAVVAADRTGIASPMKLLEYMAMGKAVVAPRIENIRDIVTDGHDGLLFAADSTDELTEVLRRLAQDAQLRGRLGREARRTVQRCRNWRSNAERVLTLVGQRTAVGR
jgi:glycosyltransferase involved in cell wall biosynthesis